MVNSDVSLLCGGDVHTTVHSVCLSPTGNQTVIGTHLAVASSLLTFSTTTLQRVSVWYMCDDEKGRCLIKMLLRPLVHFDCSIRAKEAREEELVVVLLRFLPMPLSDCEIKQHAWPAVIFTAVDVPARPRLRPLATRRRPQRHRLCRRRHQCAPGRRRCRHWSRSASVSPSLAWPCCCAALPV